MTAQVPGTLLALTPPPHRFAARAVAGALDYKIGVDQRSLPVDMQRGRPLDMQQYFKVSTTIPDFPLLYRSSAHVAYLACPRTPSLSTQTPSTSW